MTSPSSAAATASGPPVATRDRLVHATAELLLRQGYAGTGLKAVTDAGHAPIGSLYHHFPGGKEELVAEALRVAGAGYAAIVGAVLADAPDLATGIRQSFPSAAAMLEATGYADACPVATVALEVASSNDHLRQVTHEVFESWVAWLTGSLVGEGLGEPRARELALLYVGALEGGFLLCRAARSPEAMLAIGRAVADQVDAAIAAART